MRWLQPSRNQLLDAILRRRANRFNDAQGNRLGRVYLGSNPHPRKLPAFTQRQTVERPADEPVFSHSFSLARGIYKQKSPGIHSGYRGFSLSSFAGLARESQRIEPQAWDHEFENLLDTIHELELHLRAYIVGQVS